MFARINSISLILINRYISYFHFNLFIFNLNLFCMICRQSTYFNGFSISPSTWPESHRSVASINPTTTYPVAPIREDQLLPQPLPPHRRHRNCPRTCSVRACLPIWHSSKKSANRSSTWSFSSWPLKTPRLSPLCCLYFPLDLLYKKTSWAICLTSIPR